MGIKRQVKKQTTTLSKSNKELLSTGCTLLDLALGGGLPFGAVTNIVGDRSAGKTVLASQIVAEFKLRFKDKAVWDYDDAEGGYSLPTEKMFNLIIRNEDDYRSDHVEEVEGRINERAPKLEEGQKYLYVCDSVEGLQSLAEVKYGELVAKAMKEGKEAPGTYGQDKAKYMNQILRNRFVKKKNMLTIFVSQTRDKIGVTFGAVKTRQCERALEFKSFIVIYMRVAKEITKTIDKKEYTIGAVIETQVKKNKVIGSKFKPLIIMRDQIGIDNVDTNVSFLFDLIDG
ncbi:MAG: hypothetical protein BV456_13435, partial [Thermoplasmata archaeon M8B2D]